MILVPFPKRKRLKESLVTTMLMLTLVFMYCLVKEYEVTDVSLRVPKSESAIFHDVQAQLYKNFLKSEDQRLDKGQRITASIADQDKDNKVLSHMSLKDPYFNPFTTSRVGIDDVSYRHWMDMYFLFQEFASLNSASLLGIKSDSLGWKSWFSYMFVHAGFYHLLSNLVFLFLFGALVERAFGGLMTLIVFLGSGLVVVPIYVMLTGETNVPLVGASGGVCGLIAFYCICRFKEPLRFFYWVLPFEKYYGFVTLYTGVVLLIWLLSDLAGYLGAVPLFDGVAHAAHLGGFIGGACAAIAVMSYRKYMGIKDPPDDVEHEPLGKPYSIVPHLRT